MVPNCCISQGQLTGNKTGAITGANLILPFIHEGSKTHSAAWGKKHLVNPAFVELVVLLGY